MLTDIGTNVHHCVSILDLNAVLHVAAIPEDFIVYEEALHLGAGCHFPPIGQLHQVLTIQSDRLVRLCHTIRQTSKQKPCVPIAKVDRHDGLTTQKPDVQCPVSIDSS